MEILIKIVLISGIIAFVLGGLAFFTLALDEIPDAIAGFKQRRNALRLKELKRYKAYIQAAYDCGYEKGKADMRDATFSCARGNLKTNDFIQRCADVLNKLDAESEEGKNE